MLSNNVGLHIPCLHSGRNSGWGRKGGKEKTSKAVSREVAKRILGDTDICPSVYVPSSSQAKHTTAQMTAG